MKWRFWEWFFHGLNGSSGLGRYWNRWLILQAFIAALLTWLTQKELAELATSFLLPLASILVGLSFAWSGNAQTILQTDEIRKMATQHPDGIENYVYGFQSAVLLILVTLIAWGLAAAGVFSGQLLKYPIIGNISCETLIELALFLLASIAVRECWHIIFGVQALLLQRNAIQRSGDTASMK